MAASTSRSVMIWATRATMSSATSAIRATVGRTSSGTAICGHPQAGDLGDVHREVAHPLELADHPQRRHDDPQVAGDGLLERQQGEAVVLDPLGRLVDLGVGADDLLGLLGVAGQQRLGGQPHRLLDVAAHGGEVAEDGVELVMEGLTHARGPYGRSVTSWRQAVNAR